MANFMKACSFLHADFTESMKAVEMCVVFFFRKKLSVKIHLLKKNIYVVGAHWNCLFEAISM